MCDFEVSLINTPEQTLETSDKRSCFFHLNQSQYRKIQAEGWQEMYNDKDDRVVEIGTQIVGVLAVTSNRRRGVLIRHSQRQNFRRSSTGS